MAAIGSSNIGFQVPAEEVRVERGYRPRSAGAVKLFMEQGRLEPVETRVKNNRRGLGSKEPKAKPKPKVEDDVEKDPKKPKQDMPTKRRAKLAAKRIRKLQEEEKRLQEKEFEIAFFREFWPDNV
ncbi:hypothetical protein PR202_gb07050 [Eleusine coracana subsp. coracana]|uniref:Uncharacterized protein n=1 Tax=Eleusine coracana subsp. coracana TaxID=191504 RepID=A0AAV5EB59_ELECO|nr:hypothetical protein PR202_gb07050 [Eleusine coracana subsp. coracana]